MKKYRKIILVILSFIIIIIINYISFQTSKYYTTKWYEQYLAETAILPSGYCKHITNRFESVLFIDHFNDTTYKKFNLYRNVDRLPCISQYINRKILFIDISKDNKHRGNKYYSKYSNLVEIGNGDTLWISAKISNTPDSLSGIFPISIIHSFTQYKYTDWIKDYFSQMF